MSQTTRDVEIKTIMNKPMYKLSREIAPLRIKNISIILDSRNSAAIIPLNTFKYTWDFTYDGLVRPGVVTTLKKIYNIVGMRMFDTILYTPAVYTSSEEQPIYSSTYTFLIEELITQSFITHGQYFHFIGGLDYIPSSYNGKTSISFEKYNHGFFWFYKPVQELNKLTISIGNPILPYRWPEECYNGVLDLFSSPGNVLISISLFPLVSLYIGQSIGLDLLTFDGNLFTSLPPEVQAMFAPNIYKITADLGGGTYIMDASYYFYADPLQVSIRYVNTSYRIPLEFYYIDDDVDEIEEYEERHQFDPSIGDLGENNVLELLGIKDTTTLYKELAPAVYYRKQYLYFDARYALSIKDNKMTWLYDAYNVRDGTVNSSILLRDIVSMRIYQFIWRDYNYNTRIIDTLYVGVSPIINQSMIIEEKRIHFMLGESELFSLFANVRIDRVTNPKYYNWGEYKFNKPIQIRDQLSLSFWYSNKNSDILPYTFNFWTSGNVDLVNYSSGILLIDTPSFSEFPMYGVLYIRGFTTTDPVADNAFINYVNRKEGHRYYWEFFAAPWKVYMLGQWDYNIPIIGTAVNTNTELSSVDDNLAVGIEFTYQKRTPGYDIDDLGDEVRAL
jgi:hypothetical protein